MNTPLSAELADVNNRTLAWALVVILSLAAGLGISLWLKHRLILVTVIAGIFVVVAMWMERWLIIIPVMTHPRLIPYTMYFPTLTEISLTAASAALLALMVLVFFKIFPAISIWEVSEQRVIEEAKSKIVIPAPKPSNPDLLRRWRIKR